MQLMQVDSEFSVARRSSRASGEWARRLERIAAEVGNRFLTDEYLFGNREVAFNALENLARDCAQPNWDGEGAAPVNFDSVAAARRALVSIPPGAPSPDLSIDRDGSITMEWYFEPARRLSVSLTEGIFADYAGINELHEYSGRIRMGDALPLTVRQHLASLLAE